MTTPVPWSMKKPGPIRAPGVDVDAGARVGVLRHHARDQRDAQQQQLVGDAVDRDRFQAGIAEDDLVIALRRRVAFEGGLHVVIEQIADVRQLAEQLDRLLLGHAFQVDGRAVGLSLVVLVPQGPADLDGQLVVEPVDQIADVVFHIAHVQVLPPPVAGIEDIEQIAEDLGNRLPVGQRLVAEVASCAAIRDTNRRSHPLFPARSLSNADQWPCDFSP